MVDSDVRNVEVEATRDDLEKLELNEKVLKKIGEHGENLAGDNSYKGAHIFSDYTFIKTAMEFTVGP